MLHMVSEYQLIRSGSSRLLGDKVNAAIKDGWVPSGTLVVKGDQFYQAMVKFKENL